MAITPHLGITLIEQAQAQKEITANTAFARLELLLNTGLIDKDINTPPGSTVAGDVYIVGPSADGEWTGQDGKITWFDQLWRFLTPRVGCRVWLLDEEAYYVYNGTEWWPLLRLERRETLVIPATLLRPSVSNGCAALAGGSVGAGQPSVYTLDFDASSVEYAEVTFPMPKRWDAGTVSLQFLWSHASGSASYGVVWNAQVVAIGDGDGFAISFPTATAVNDVGGAADTLYTSPETSAITIGNTPAQNDTLCLRVGRNATHGSDTLTVDARLHAVRLFYTAVRPSDD